MIPANKKIRYLLHLKLNRTHYFSLAIAVLQEEMGENDSRLFFTILNDIFALPYLFPIPSSTTLMRSRNHADLNSFDIFNVS